VNGKLIPTHNVGALHGKSHQQYPTFRVRHQPVSIPHLFHYQGIICSIEQKITLQKKAGKNPEYSCEICYKTFIFTKI
jgi:hypothetical protein